MIEDECFICCERYKTAAVYACNHKACYKCATRLIYMYKDKRCPICKSQKDMPLFKELKNNEKRIESQKEKKLTKINDLMKITTNMTISTTPITDTVALFEKQSIREMVYDLLKEKCSKCSRVFKDSKELVDHVKKEHSVLLCTTCIENKHMFSSEYIFYNLEKLSLHRKGELGEIGFEGHVFCEFCNHWLYSKEAAKQHCRQTHQVCTICEVLNLRLQFYKNFSDLESHYRSQHYCCTDNRCVQQHAFAFAYKTELCVHALKHHNVDMKLNDLILTNNKNPLVFSLADTNNVEETDEVEIAENKPFFPSFSKTPQSIHESSQPANGVPSFLNRQTLLEIRTEGNNREKIVKQVVSQFNKEISSSIESFIKGAKQLKDLVAEIEDSAGQEGCLKILQKVSFLGKQNEVNEFVREYKKLIKFPTFRKTEKTEEIKSNKTGKQAGFRIIDFTKKQ